MDSSIQLVLFTLDDRRFALRLSFVERVIRAVAVVPLPGAPRIVLGVINIEGFVIPVVDIRSRFGLPIRPPDIDDQFILAHTATRTLVVVVDEVSRIIEANEQDIVSGEVVLSGLDHVKGLLKLEGEIILIHDLDRFLSLEEEKVLNYALAQEGAAGYEK